MKDKRIVIIGMGVVGTALGISLKRLQYNLVGVYRRNIVLGEELSRKWALPFNEDLSAMVKSSDWIFIATPDGSIQSVLDHLIECKALKEGQTLVHLSGALTSEILIKARLLGLKVMSFHPLQSFASVEKAIFDLSNCYFALEGDQEVVEEAKVFVKEIGARYLELCRENKVLYHLAAVMASNYLVTLSFWAQEAFKAAGLKSQDTEALIPLMKSVLHNLEILTPSQALTGPIARGDIGTIMAHLGALEEKNLRELTKVYATLGKYTLPVAGARGILSKDLFNEMERAFDQIKEG